jgi:hypothetical protein
VIESTVKSSTALRSSSSTAKSWARAISPCCFLSPSTQQLAVLPTGTAQRRNLCCATPVGAV